MFFFNISQSELIGKLLSLFIQIYLSLYNLIIIAMLSQKELYSFVITYLEKKVVTQELIKDTNDLVSVQNRKFTQEWKERLNRFSSRYLPAFKRKSFQKALQEKIAYEQKIYPEIVNLYNGILEKQIRIDKIEDVETISNQSQSTIQNFETQTIKRIQLNLKNCKTYQEFLQKQLYQIIDILQRKCGITTYYNILINQTNLIDQKDTQRYHLAKLISSITLIDFIITLIKITEPSSLIPVLLSQQSAPIPILYSVKQKIVNNQQIIHEVLGFKRYPIIINIWNEGAAKSARNIILPKETTAKPTVEPAVKPTVDPTVKPQPQPQPQPQPTVEQKMYFCQLMNISPKNFEGSSFESNINVFKLNLVPNQTNSHVLLVNLVNYTKEDPASLLRKQTIIKNLSKLASLVIIHIDDNMLLDKLQPQQNEKSTQSQKPSIWKNYQFLFKQQITRIYINQLAYCVSIADTEILLKRQDPLFKKQYLFNFQINLTKSKEDDKITKKNQLSAFLRKSLIQSSLKSSANFKSFLFEQKEIKSQIQQLQIQIRKFLQGQFAQAKKQNIQDYKAYFLPKYVASRILNQERIKMNNMNFEQYLKDIQEEQALKREEQFKKQQQKQKQQQQPQQQPQPQPQQQPQQQPQPQPQPQLPQQKQPQTETQNKNKQPPIILSKKQHKENYLKIIQNSMKRQEELKNILNNKSLSQFLQKSIQFIKRDDDVTLRPFAQILMQQINKKITPKLQSLEKQIPKQDRKKKSLKPSFLQRKNKILEGRITVENIIQQLSFYNELIIDRNAEVQDSYQQKYIDNYYSKCINNLYPFSLVDGETSNFGNEGLRRFFKSLNQRLDRKKIFVVSVIGSRASGKASLLNILFRYNIHLREDPYAKGVYMGLCQINTAKSVKDKYQMNNKMIIVLDTDGIMSMDITVTDLAVNSEEVRKNFAAFDHQVASILMSQSDLTIFSSELKEEKQVQKKDQVIIPNQLSLTIAICYKVLDALYSNNFRPEQIVPKNVIIVFSGESQKKIKKQSIIDNLIQIVTPILQVSLINTPQQKKKLSKDESKQIFSKYIRLQEQNIFLLPKNQKKSQQIQLFKALNQDYGVNVLRLRNRVMKILQTLQENGLYPNTVIEFFNDCKVSWQILLLTGKNIVQVTTLKQSEKKSKLHKIYRKKYHQIYNLISTNLQERYSMKKESKFNLQLESIHLANKIRNITMTPNNNKSIKSLHNIWGYFEQFLLNDYIKYFQQNEFNQSKTSKDIIYLAFQVFRTQAFQSNQQTAWTNQYNLKVQKLLNHLMYKKIMLFFEEFQNKFKNQRLKVFQESASAILLDYLIVKSKEQRIKKKKEFLTQCENLMNKVLSQEVNRAEIEQNLANTFKIIFQSENVFLKELQVNSIKDCTDFEKSINNEYGYHLNKFILFADEQEVPQQRKGEITNIVVKCIQEFSQQIIKMWSNTRITNMDIKNLFSWMKNNIFDKKVNQAQLKVREISKKIYTSKQNVNDNTQIKNIINKKILQLTSLATKKPQKKQKYNSYNAYLSTISKRLDKIFQEKIILNKINLKIILLSRLFNLLLNIFQQKEIKQIQHLKAQFSKNIRDKQRVVDQRIQNKLNQNLDYALNQQILKYQNEIKVNIFKDLKTNYLQRINSQLKKYYLSLISVQKTLLQKSIQNPLLQKQENSQKVKNIYIQCFKYIMDPAFCIYEQYKKQFSSQKLLKVDFNKALKQNILQFEKIQNYKPDQFTKYITKNNIDVKELIQAEVFSQKDVRERFLIKLAVFINNIKTKQYQQKLQKQVSYSTEMQQIAKLLLQKKQDLIGCTERCPFCGAKCIQSIKHAGNHRAYRHSILAFGGCRNSDNSFLLQNCLSNRMKKRWTNDDKSVEDYIVFIQKFKDWKDDISSPNTEQLNPTLIKIWANVQDAVILTWKKKFPLQKFYPSSFQQVIDEKKKKQIQKDQIIFEWEKQKTQQEKKEKQLKQIIATSKSNKKQ